MKTMMMACGLSLMLAAPASAGDEGEVDIGKLGWLVGEWTFVDEEIAGDYRETGTRDCRWALGRKYIVCESTGRTAKGTERGYTWSFNYNERLERFEGTGLFENYPFKHLYEIDVSENGQELFIRYFVWYAEGAVREGQARVTYNGRDKYVWDSLGGPPDPQSGEPTVSFRDVVTRRSPRD